MGDCVCISFPACLLAFLFPSTQVTIHYGAVTGIVPIRLQSIIQIIYLNDRNKRTWQQLIQTTLHRDSITERWTIEGRTDKWKRRKRKREVGWAWHADSVFCESYRGQGLSRSPVMLHGLWWGWVYGVLLLCISYSCVCMHAMPLASDTSEGSVCSHAFPCLHIKC